MNNKVKLIFGVAAFALLLVVASIGYNQLTKANTPQQSVAFSPSQSSAPSQTSAPSPSQGAKKAAPNFTVQDMSGNTVAFSDFKGKPIVINFWASWCPPCKAEMPDYEKMYKEYASKGVVFLMVDLVDGSRETVSIAKQYLKDNKYTFTAYFDVKGSAAVAYNITSIPDSIFIDKSGNIVNAYVGMINSATMKKNIEVILNS